MRKHTYENTHTQMLYELTVSLSKYCCVLLFCVFESLSLSLFVGIGKVTFPGDIDFDSCSKALCVLATVNAAVIRMNLYI